MAKKIIYICSRCEKDIDPNTEVRVFFKAKHYHQSCLIEKLKKSQKPKYSPEEINEIIEKYTPKSQKSLMQKNGATKKSKVKVPKANLPKNEDRKALIEKVGRKYALPRREDIAVGRILDSINSGTYKRLCGKPISYEKIDKMFDYFEQYLYKTHRYSKDELKTRSIYFYI